MLIDHSKVVVGQDTVCGILVSDINRISSGSAVLAITSSESASALAAFEAARELNRNHAIICLPDPATVSEEFFNELIGPPAIVPDKARLITGELGQIQGTQIRIVDYTGEPPPPSLTRAEIRRMRNSKRRRNRCK